jgi:uncharacterized zinc-type alcohol dehydrogenase-like protein
MKIAAFASTKEKEPLIPFTIERRALRPKDVRVEILYCGVSHSDIHQVKNEWRNTLYPIVPGHEIVGVVIETSQEATKFQKGEIVAVGCLVDSCRECSNCQKGLEQYCEKGARFTYNSRDKIDRSITFGGYAEEIVVDEAYLLRVPKELEENLPGVAPLLCAGITSYSPLMHWKVQRGTRVGVVGVGGLGHIAIKFAKALGAFVVAFTTSQNKREEIKRLGADEVVLSKNQEEMRPFQGSLDFILNTVSASHNLDPFIALLNVGGTLCLLGAPDHPHPTPNMSQLIFKRRSLAGSLIGGIQETQEMLNFCGKHKIFSDIELIRMEQINEAYERVLKNDVKYRFVIDLKSL